jgi:hypothetical protein
MRRAMTSNRAYSTNRERYRATVNQNTNKNIISSSGSTNRERYIASQYGGGGNNRGNQSNTNTSSTTTTTTTNTGPVDSGGGSSTDKKDNDKVKKLLKKTGKKINRFVAENTNLLPENYEEAMSLAYGGARAGVGKVFDLGNNVYAGANITAKTGGILKGDTTILADPITGETTTVPTEVPDVDKSNVLDKSSIGVTGAIGGEYGFGTASFDTKEGVTLGYDYTGDTKMFTPSILGKDIPIGITPNVEATFKPFEDGDNFDAKLGATVTTPIGGADVFVTEEGKFGIGKSFNFKSGGLLDKKRG